MPDNKAGTFRINLTGEAQYKSFVPTPLLGNKLVEVDDELLSLLTKTNHILGFLDGTASRLPNIDQLISMYIRKEALLSSQIEGTQATLDDILDPSAEENQNLNVTEVLNYIRAANYAVSRRLELPLCNRLLLEIHEVLLEGIRGSEKNPGEFRRSQNWIGPGGSTIKTAVYIPPSPDDMSTALSDLEKFINEDDNIDFIIKAALIHYQFETIHPFLDGNGRVGRLLITLFLMECKIITRPALYISYFLKMNRIEYYDRLMEVRYKGNYEQWVKFFTKAVLLSAEDALETIYKLLALREKNTVKIEKLGKFSKNAQVLCDYLEQSPIIDIGKTAKALSLSYNTVAKSALLLTELGILVQTTQKKRGRVFAYEEYLSVLREGTGAGTGAGTGKYEISICPITGLKRFAEKA